MSVTTTKKQEQFQAQPLQDCKLSDVPGVGAKTLEKLNESNIDTAEKLVGHFMVMGRDTEKMTSWLEDVCEVRGVEAKKVAEGLAEKAAKIVIH
mmetsp:Transcript_5263/g.3699  ORF Transcript_5263/g.3699 Transcript_5263/m.3699 type:complete len:94 (+) Transcript_5263:3-284(+)